MKGLDVDATLEQLAAIHRQMLGVFVERRRQRSEGGPTRLQEFALLAIRDRGGMQVSEVGALLEISPATTSQLLTAMESKGWLQREMLQGDRRRHRVTLTEAGGGVVRQMDARRRERLSRVLAELTAEERAQLVWLAQRLVEVLSRVPESHGEVF